MTLLLVAIAAACSDSDSPTSPDGVTLEVQFDHDKHHLVPINGAEEVPTRNTQATGRAIFHIAGDGQKMAYELMVSNITNVVQAHIHLRAGGDERQHRPLVVSRTPRRDRRLRPGEVAWTA